MRVGRLIALFAVLLIIISCAKDQEPLVLDADYMFVSDIQEYCQGSCDQTQSWENNTVHVKGHIMDINSDSVMSDYYTQGKFYLEDIRNGMFIEINITDNKDEIFNKIRTGGKLDMFYVIGITKAVFAHNENNCTKGVIILLNDQDDIYFVKQ